MNANFSTISLTQRLRILFAVLVLSCLFIQHEVHASMLNDKHISAGAGLLTPSAQPYALSANSGKQTVRISVPVQLIGARKTQVVVFLRRSGEKQSIAMNDLGKEGDFRAKDGIYGVYVQIDTDKIKPDSCLSYETYIKQGRIEIASRPLRLCVSSFPVRIATSDTVKPVVLQDGVKVVANEVVLYAKPATSAATIRELARSINASVVGSILPLNAYQLRFSVPVSANRMLELVAQLGAQAGVAGVSVNALGEPAGHIDVTTDPEFANQHGVKLVLKHPTSAGMYVWDTGANGTGVTVVVADEGLDRTHPEFGTPGNCQVINNECGPLAANDDHAAPDILQWHGTRVTGIVAAKAMNLLGIAGVAHGSTVHPYKMAGYTLANMQQALTDVATYVASDGTASVINASFSGGPWSPATLGYAAAVNALCTAVNSAVATGGGAIAVMAAGNTPEIAPGVPANPDDWYYPARCNQHAAVPVANRSRIIAVGNSTSVVTANCGSVGVDQRCAAKIPYDSNLPGSNYGTWVDIAAPGSDIRTTTQGGVYTSSTGTSFSTPIVSGAVAILKSCGVVLDQIKPVLISSANVAVPYPTSASLTTTPRLDVYRALAQVNHAPTGITFSPLALYEKTNTTGYDVGGLTVADADSCDKHTYSIAGGVDMAKFSIGGAASDRLMLTDGVLNFIAKPNYFVDVRVTDFFGASAVQSLMVNVLNVNDAPAGTDKTVTTSEDTAYTFSAADFGFTDPNDIPPNNLSAVIITTLPLTGQLQLGGASVTAGQPVAVADLGTLTFIPALHAYGPSYASFTFQVVDDGGFANGGLNTDPTPNTLTINVTRVTHAPTGHPSITDTRSGVPVTDGTRKVGDLLAADTSPIANPDAWSVSGYQWQRADTIISSPVNVAGAVNSTYALDWPDYQKYVTVCVTYTDGGVPPVYVTLCSNVADASAVGDPHVTTVDGLHYDFQSAGEFVALRGADGMEIQTRHTPVSTASAITDPYSGLTASVSINTAVAARVGHHRVTFQPDISGTPASAGLVLRLDGAPTTVTANGLNLGSGARLSPLPSGAIQVDFPDQTTMVVTPGWWAVHGVWYLNVSVLHTSAFEGIMGARAHDSWLPRLSDGTSLGAMPNGLRDRYVDLYEKFADSWRVNDKTSLFDYAPDTSTSTFTLKSWPRQHPPYVVAHDKVEKPVKRGVAVRVCRMIADKVSQADCQFDVMVTGNPGFAATYLLNQKILAGLTIIRVHDDRGNSKDKEAVTFTATVAHNTTRMGQEGLVATGTVQFMLDGSRVGMPVKLDRQGQARLKMSRIKVGGQRVTASYFPAKGSAFLPSTSLDESLRLSRENDE